MKKLKKFCDEKIRMQNNFTIRGLAKMRRHFVSETSFAILKAFNLWRCPCLAVDVFQFWD